MEFTIEDNSLSQACATRNGKRTAKTAALKIAHDSVDEGVISEKEAVLMIRPQKS